MNTLILLLAMTDPGTEIDAPLPPEVAAREKANQEKFLRDKAKREANEAYREASRGQMRREIAEREAKKKAGRAGALLVSGGKHSKPQYQTVKERAAKLYANRNAKSKKTSLPDGPVENPFIKK